MQKTLTVSYISGNTGNVGLKEAVKNAVLSSGSAMLSLDDSSYSGLTQAEAIRKLIDDCDIVVADITGSKSITNFALGLAEASGKILLTMGTTFTDMPPGLLSATFFNYGSDTKREDFVSRLSSILDKMSRHPERYSSKAIHEKRKAKQHIFISYSHQDREFLDRLIVHLKPLEKDGRIEFWADTKLRAGDKWEIEITKALSQCNVAILIISADFLASDFIVNNELPPLLKSAESRGMRVLPIIAKPCRFTRDSNLKEFQSINDPKDALILMSPGHQEKVYDTICAEVEKYI